MRCFRADPVICIYAATQADLSTRSRKAQLGAGSVSLPLVFDEGLARMWDPGASTRFATRETHSTWVNHRVVWRPILTPSPRPSPPARLGERVFPRTDLRRGGAAPAAQASGGEFWYQLSRSGLPYGRACHFHEEFPPRPRARPSSSGPTRIPFENEDEGRARFDPGCAGLGNMQASSIAAVVLAEPRTPGQSRAPIQPRYG